MKRILLLFSLPYDFYLAILATFAGVYLVWIAPFLFRFWIMPKIENRYKTSFRVKDEDYPYPLVFVNWFMPPIQAAMYIFCLYIGWKKLLKITLTWKRQLPAKLEAINFDIKTASKAEIVMSFISIFSIIVVFVCGIIAAIKQFLLKNTN